MPSFSSSSAAFMPSQVDAALIRTRSRETPASSYKAINLRALARVASLSKDKRASTSVEIRPGTYFRISVPTMTASLSPASRICWALSSLWVFAQATACSRKGAYSGICAAFSIKDGLVVASSGKKSLIAVISPVSATMVVNSFS